MIVQPNETEFNTFHTTLMQSAKNQLYLESSLVLLKISNQMSKTTPDKTIFRNLPDNTVKTY